MSYRDQLLGELRLIRLYLDREWLEFPPALEWRVRPDSRRVQNILLESLEEPLPDLHVIGPWGHMDFGRSLSRILNRAYARTAESFGEIVTDYETVPHA